MKTFPMFLMMAGRQVVIVGGGEQAARKTRLIVKTEAKITLCAPSLDPELTALAQSGRIGWDETRVTVKTFKDCVLTFIATGCPGADAAFHGVAKAAGALVNVVDQPDLCDAITPSIVDRSPVVVAIGTEGTAPVLARQIKTKVEQMLEPRLGDLAAVAGRLRGQAARYLSPRKRRDLWRWVFEGPIRRRHKQGAERAAAEMIKTAIKTGEFGSEACGSVALVGAGPGSSDLITLRGVQRLQEADVIYYDRLVGPDILDLARRDAERIYVGKTPGCHDRPQDKINQTLIAAAKRGLRVVRLKCGDVGIFGRAAEELSALRAADVAVEIVPGVTAASAAVAAVGDVLTERGRTDTLVLTTGQCRTMDDAPDWLAHLHPGTNIGVYMGVGAAPDIAACLLQAGLGDVVDIMIVAQAGWQNQTHARCTPATLVETIQSQAVAAPAMLFLTYPKPTAKRQLRQVPA